MLVLKFSYSPLNKITISNIKVSNSGGTLLRIKNSNVRNSVFDKNILGLYIEGDSFNNIIEKNTFSRSTLREGLVLDAACNNIVRLNQIFNNRTNGISIYKNCGEEFGLWKRNYSASHNVIEGNVIYGHNQPNKSVITISEGAGIAIGLRQGLAFLANDLTTFEGCSDVASHMFKWNRINKEYFKSILIDPYNYKITNSIISTQSNRTHYVGPHWDFADDNKVINNIIYDNKIGIYNAARNTIVESNRFFKWFKEPLLNNTDVYFGNIVADVLKRPILNMHLQNNNFHYARNPILKATSTESRDSITGLNSPSQFTIADWMTGLRLIQQPNQYVSGKKFLFEFFYQRN